MLPHGLAIVAVPAARGPARRVHRREAATLAELPQGARRRHGVAAPRRRRSCGCGPTCTIVPLPRQCRDAARASSTTARSTRPCWRSRACSGSASRAHATAILSTDEMLPAVGQGTIAIEMRAPTMRDRARCLAPLDDADDRDCARRRARVPGACSTAPAARRSRAREDRRRPATACAA